MTIEKIWPRTRNLLRLHEGVVIKRSNIEDVARSHVSAATVSGFPIGKKVRPKVAKDMI